MIRFGGGRTVFLLTSLMLFCSISGIAIANSGTKLKLADCIALAVEQSSDVALAELNVTDAEKNLEKTQADLLINGNLQSVKYASDNLDSANAAVLTAKDDVASRVEQAFYDAILAEKTVQLRTDGYNKANKQLTIGKTKLKAGLATNLDVTSLSDNVVSAKYSLEQAKANQRIAFLKLNRAMGSPLDTAVLLEDSLTYSPVAVNLKSGTEYAMANRRDIKQARLNITRKEEELSYKNNEYTPAIEKEQAAREVEKAKLNLTKVISDVRISVEEAYVSVTAAQNDVDIKTRNLERAKTYLKNIEQRYQTGLAFTNDLISAQSNYDNSAVDRMQAIRNYKLSLAAWYKTIGKPHPGLSTK